MFNYTQGLAVLMQDIVKRVPALRFIDMSEVVVFGRHGRVAAEGAFATCHCLTLPTSEPGYYFWRDRATGKLTRRSEWFVTKSPEVYIGTTRIKYLISFALPRFCDQSLERSRKREHYPGVPHWIAKLDTVVHELYHIDPADSGIRKIERTDGSYSPRSHGPEFYEAVAGMVREYLGSQPDPDVCDFLRYNFAELQDQYGGIVGTTFRNFPSYPQRYIEAIVEQDDTADIAIEPVKPSTQPARYTEDDLQIHQFLDSAARRLVRKGQFRAA